METLLQELLNKGVLTQEKVAAIQMAVKESGKTEEEVLLEKKVLPEEELFKIKSEFIRTPIKEVIPEEVPLDVLDLIPEDSVRHYKMIPVGKANDLLEVGMVYPEDLKAREALNFLARKNNFSYKIYLITQTSFLNLLKQHRTLKKEVGRALEELETELKEEQIETTLFPALAGSEIGKLAEEAPIIKMVAVILKDAIEGKASDIHIEPTRENLRVRFRFDGILYPSLSLPIRIHQAVIARIKILSSLRIDESRIPQDGRFSAQIEGRNIDFRVSTFPTTLGEKVAVRILDSTEAFKSFEELGLEGRNLEILKKSINIPYGMILVTGPTGSGKTTTLYTILQLFNKEGVNIITLEDPVEYFIGGINQSQIRSEIGYSFAQGLRQVLRQDPDIIMVGEIRDEETSDLAIHASLTGHIVLSTLHTNNAVGVIPRLVDMGAQPFLIPPALKVAISQRLVGKICSHCKKKVKPTTEFKKIMEDEINSLPEQAKGIKIPSPLMLYQGVGCNKCKQRGYLGRVGIFEVLAMTRELSEAILKEPSESKVMEEANRQGMMTMRQDGVLKALAGVTTMEEVLKTTMED